MTAGSLARIFTSIQETNDSLIILNFVASSFVNIILTLQILYYWNVPMPAVVPLEAKGKLEDEEKKSQNEKPEDKKTQ